MSYVDAPDGLGGMTVPVYMKAVVFEELRNLGYEIIESEGIVLSNDPEVDDQINRLERAELVTVFRNDDGTYDVINDIARHDYDWLADLAGLPLRVLKLETIHLSDEHLRVLSQVPRLWYSPYART